MSIRKLGLLVSATVLTAALAPSPHAAAAAEDASRAASRVAQMDLPQLQIRAARLQAGFVRASLQLQQAQLDLLTARGGLADAQERATRAQAHADVESADLESYLALLYTQGPTLDSDLMVLVTGLDKTDAMWRENLVFEEVTSDQATVVERARQAQAEADHLRTDAQQRRDEADAAQDAVHDVLAKISARADQVTAAARDSFADNTEAALFNDAQQTARNTAAKAAWRRYLRRLDSAGVTPPAARKLRDPLHLPRGLQPLPGATGDGVPGVALSGDTASLAVVPRQVVTAVDEALGTLAKPYVAGGAGPETFDCAGLVNSAYPALDLGSTPAAQYENTRTVALTSVQVGDLVFFATQGAGIHHVGLYLGGDLMLAADGPSSQVAVMPLPGRPYAVTRPSLPLGAQANHPHHAPRGDGTQDMSCGAELLRGGGTSAGLVSPVAPGSFTLTSRFGQPGVHWGSGFHTGLDFAAPVGTQVVAARSGTVSVSHPEWAGNLVTVDHGEGFTTTYAHLSSVFVTPGQQVLGGQSLGSVGQLGNTTGPHLHFEVVILGTPVDPSLFLGGVSGGTGGWGGFLNGMIPTSELCGLKSAPGQLLRCDAARAYDALALAYRGALGTDLCITDSYRTFASQVTTFANKPGLAAVPGTSNHGWALAVDLCGGIERAGSPQNDWLRTNAPAFGWVHPAWADPGGGRPEPWHWEFGNVS